MPDAWAHRKHRRAPGSRFGRVTSTPPQIRHSIPVGHSSPDTIGGFVDNSREGGDPQPSVLQPKLKPFTRRGRGKWCCVALASGNPEASRGAAGRRSAGVRASARPLDPDDIQRWTHLAHAGTRAVARDLYRRPDRTARQGPLADFGRRPRVSPRARGSSERGSRVIPGHRRPEAMPVRQAAQTAQWRGLEDCGRPKMKIIGRRRWPALQSNIDALRMNSTISKLPCSALVCVGLAVGLAVSAPSTSPAQSTAPPSKAEKLSRPDLVKPGAASSDKAKASAPVTQRQKIRDCGVKWREEKKAKGLSGKAAYLKFLSACLKGCEGLECLFDEE
jgi:hypothetical protein